MKPVSSEFQITFRRFPASLLESVKHIDSLSEFSHIEDSVFESSVCSSDLRLWWN